MLALFGAWWANMVRAVIMPAGSTETPALLAGRTQKLEMIGSRKRLAAGLTKHRESPFVKE